MFAQKDFKIDTVLNKPLMAHLATVDKGEPRDSPVWFIWEESYLWIFGTSEDSFIKRLQQEPQCAVGSVGNGLFIHNIFLSKIHFYSLSSYLNVYP